MAVGIAVTAVAFAAYATVRMQSIDSLDASLHARAVRPRTPDTLDALARRRDPDLGARRGRREDHVPRRRRADRAAAAAGAPPSAIGRTEFRVALGREHWSARTVRHRRRSATAWWPCPPTDGEALILAQSLEPTDQMLDRLGLVMLLFGLAGMISAGLAGWAVARNGLRPVRRLTTAVEDIARTERLDPIPVEGNDEVARLAQAFNAMLDRALRLAGHGSASWSPTPATSCVRR